MKVKSVFLWTVISLPAFLMSACGDPNPRENVDSTISKAIFLLEKRDVENLIKNYIPPKNLEKMLKKNDLKDLVKKYSDERRTKMLITLRSAQSLDPEYSHNNTLATFRTSPYKLVLIKIESYWYFK